MNDTDALDNLTLHIGNVLRDLSMRGFQAPIYTVMVGSNGSILAGTFTGGTGGTFDFEASAEHYPDPVFALPVNIMFVDGKTGEAARVVIDRPDQEEYTIQ